MPSALRRLVRLWKISRYSKIALAMQLGLQLGDAALGRDQFDALGAGQARFEATVNAALPPPGVDRLGVDPKRLGDLGEWSASGGRYRWRD